MPDKIAEVRMHNGVPTAFIDGRPVFYAAAWFPLPGTEPGDAFKHVVQATAKRTGVHLYAIENGTARFGAPGPLWIPGPGEGRDGIFDFDSVEAELGAFLDADPEARFHIRVYTDMNPFWAEDKWFARLHPIECLVNDEGPQPECSFASTVWRDYVHAFIEQFVAHIDSIGLSDRVAAYQVNAGTSCEWFKYALNIADRVGDFSAPMQRHFRGWLRRAYAEDEQSLRAAWGDPNVTFETASVPSRERQLGTTHGVLRDPARERPVVDYLQAIAELNAETGIGFCRKVKASCGGRSLAGLFYGYWLGFQLNSDYFRDQADLPAAHTRLQRTGHLGLRRVLESPHVDFLTSPMDYGFRGLGGHCPPMQPVDAVNLHGKLYIQENDDRSWHATLRDYGACRSRDEFLAVYRRTLADAFTTGQGSWSTSIPLHVQRAESIAGNTVVLPHSQLVEDLPAGDCARFVDEYTACREVGEQLLDVDRSPCAEICALLDPQSFYHQTYLKNLELPLVEWQHVQGLPRLGAPSELHILDDFLEGRLRPFKLYLFVNAFQLDDARRAQLKRELRRDNRVAVWIYAGGPLNRDFSLDHMTDLTGFRFGMTPTPWGPFMHVTDFDHPITRDVPQDLFWGTDLNLSPTFYVRDSEARVLGNVVHAQGRCAEGLAVKAFPEWRSVFVAAPNLPAPLLRGLARYADVHVYNDAGDVLYACRELLSVHTVRGGRRTFRLPRRAELVYDLFAKHVVARDTDAFDVDLPPASTHVYYTGPAAKGLKQS